MLYYFATSSKALRLKLGKELTSKTRIAILQACYNFSGGPSCDAAKVVGNNSY